MPRELTVQLYTPHAGQIPMHMSAARFKVANCGRRFGKTLMGCNELLKGALENPSHRYWWVSPSYKQTKMAFEMMALAARPVLKKDPNWTDFRMDFINGSIIEGRSAERYNNLRGPGLDGAVLDECRDIKRQAWYESMRAMFSDTNGWATFISTPRGHDWFWEMAMIAQQPRETSYEYFSFPTAANPYIPREEIEEARSKLPADVFAQEYLAVFLEDGATVFRGVDRCIGGVLEPPQPGHFYVIGYDPAKYQDYAVMTVVDCSVRPLRVVAWFRYNGVEYGTQIKRLIALGHLYNKAGITMDATGAGDPLLEQLREVSELTIEGYVFTNTSKKDLVEGLQIAIEQVQVMFPNIPELVGELKAFGYHMTPARTVVYSAPDGLHDDCVISLALALYAARSGGEVAFAVAGGQAPWDAQGPQHMHDAALRDMRPEQAAEIRRRERVASRILGQAEQPWTIPIRMEQ